MMVGVVVLSLFEGLFACINWLKAICDVIGRAVSKNRSMGIFRMRSMYNNHLVVCICLHADNITAVLYLELLAS